MCTTESWKKKQFISFSDCVWYVRSAGITLAEKANGKIILQTHPRVGADSSIAWPRLLLTKDIGYSQNSAISDFWKKHIQQCFPFAPALLHSPLPFLFVSGLKILHTRYCFMSTTIRRNPLTWTFFSILREVFPKKMEIFNGIFYEGGRGGGLALR